MHGTTCVAEACTTYSTAAETSTAPAAPAICLLLLGVVVGVIFKIIFPWESDFSSCLLFAGAIGMPSLFGLYVAGKCMCPIYSASLSNERKSDVLWFGRLFIAQILVSTLFICTQ